MAAAGLLLAALLDRVDGFLARKLNRVTAFGAVLDPLVDKILVNVFFVILVYEGVFHWWLVALATIRDVAVQIGRVRATSFGIVVRTFRVSDIRNAIQILAALVGILSLSSHVGVSFAYVSPQSLAGIANSLFVVGLILGCIGAVVFFSAYWNHRAGK
jgi:CDP-diacylglycerol--glycerol-3-phosphate 3-phosphatidyltransferase